jgi:hypothetical protein
MATEIIATIQGTGETRTHFVDFSNDLPTGVTVTSGTATHTPPSGAAVICTVGAITSNIIPVTIPALTVTGRHIVTVNATLSDAEVVTARLIIPVQWDACRVGMVNLIMEVRAMTDTGSNDYTVGGVPYWTDTQIQTVLDNNRLDVIRDPMIVEASYTDAGVYQYLTYRSPYHNFESGTAYFRVQNGAFVTEGTSIYSADYNNGIVTFNSNTAGSVMYLTGRSFDLNKTAADIWRMKAGNAAIMYDFTTDNHNLSRSQYFKHCNDMVKYYRMQAGAQSGELNRSDLNG